MTTDRRGGGEGLFADLYELTMAASYLRHGLSEPATFDLTVRRLPPRRAFLVACGLDAALRDLEELHFDTAAIAYLASLDMFDDTFLQHLSQLRFTGDVWAIPEGEVAFAQEPLLRVTAPIIEAQIVETLLLNRIGYQTMIATKAARVAFACGDRSFVDFSARRDHGFDAAMFTARAAYMCGASGTSLVAAGEAFGIPLSGTMAHSYVTRFADESEAFRTFAEDFPGRATLLLDTYDTEEGARLVARLADRLRGAGALPSAVRIDSGDLDVLARAVRAILDEAGLTDVRIVASGDLDEYRVADLVAAGAPIDAFGVGTQLGTGGDVSHLDVVYKLVDDTTGPKLKLSSGKRTIPGRKQVHRVRVDGRYAYDVLALDDEDPPPGSDALLQPVMAGGRRRAPAQDLTALRDRAARALAALSPELRRLDGAEPPYEVRLSEPLAQLERRLHARHAAPAAPVISPPRG